MKRQPNLLSEDLERIKIAVREVEECDDPQVLRSKIEAMRDAMASGIIRALIHKVIAEMIGDESKVSSVKEGA